jgi:hypothetical protein
MLIRYIKSAKLPANATYNPHRLQRRSTVPTCYSVRQFCRSWSYRQRPASSSNETTVLACQILAKNSLTRHGLPCIMFRHKPCLRIIITLTSNCLKRKKITAKQASPLLSCRNCWGKSWNALFLLHMWSGNHGFITCTLGWPGRYCGQWHICQKLGGWWGGDA